MTKKSISIIISIIMCMCMISPVTGSAKVIEPKIVKTESWTTSYYIDDDMDTLYPYIQCEADIYNDGTIKLYMWNTHEWDGFATVSHTATIVNTAPVSQNSMIYTFWNNGEPYDLEREPVKYVNDSGTPLYPSSEKIYNERRLSNTTSPIIPVDNPYSSLNLSYYACEYNCDQNYWRWNEVTARVYYAYCSSRFKDKNMDTSYYSYSYITNEYYDNKYSGALPKMAVGSGDSRDRCLWYTFKPTVDPTGTYNFRLYGHDITITPELLSGNIIAEPELTEQEKYIKQLEEENARLKASITNTNLFGDINGDNLVDVADAQMILNYYVYTLANSNAEPLEEWVSKQ